MRILLGIILLCCGPQAYAADYTDTTITRGDGEQVKVRLYGDWSGRSCPPTVIMSHGFGGSQKGLAYIGEGLTSKQADTDKGLASEAGTYRVLAMRHQESSGKRNFLKAVLTKDRTALVTNPVIHVGRELDLDAAYDFASRCNPSDIILLGHSMGAETTIIEAGAKSSHLDIVGKDRFDAYIAISPQGVGVSFNRGAWRHIEKPVLMVTGTEDDSRDGDFQTRLSAFAGLPSGKKRLAIIPKATHIELSGIGSDDVQRAVLEIVEEYLTQIDRDRLAPSRLGKRYHIKDK